MREKDGIPRYVEDRRLQTRGNSLHEGRLCMYGTMRDRAVTDALLETLNSTRPRARAWAAWALATPLLHRATTAFENLVYHDPDAAVRRMAVYGLGRHWNRAKEAGQIQRALTHALQDESPRVRLAAVESFKEMPRSTFIDRRIMPLLERIIAHDRLALSPKSANAMIANANLQRFLEPVNLQKSTV